MSMSFALRATVSARLFQSTVRRHVCRKLIVSDNHLSISIVTLIYLRQFELISADEMRYYKRTTC